MSCLNRLYRTASHCCGALLIVAAASSAHAGVVGRGIDFDAGLLVDIDLEPDFTSEVIDWAVWEGTRTEGQTLATDSTLLSASDFKAGGAGLGKSIELINNVDPTKVQFTQFANREVFWFGGVNEASGDNRQWTNAMGAVQSSATVFDDGSTNPTPTGSGNGVRITNADVGEGLGFTFAADPGGAERIARLFLRVEGGDVFDFVVSDGAGGGYTEQFRATGNQVFIYEIAYNNSGGASQLDVDIIADEATAGLRLAGAALGSQSYSTITQRIFEGDFNFDFQVDGTDWNTFISNLDKPLSSDPATAYTQGDLNGDLVSDFDDFLLFKESYNAANGPAALEALIAGVPEPTGIALLIVGLPALVCSRRRISRR